MYLSLLLDSVFGYRYTCTIPSQYKLAPLHLIVNCSHHIHLWQHIGRTHPSVVANGVYSSCVQKLQYFSIYCLFHGRIQLALYPYGGYGFVIVLSGVCRSKCPLWCQSYSILEHFCAHAVYQVTALPDFHFDARRWPPNKFPQVPRMHKECILKILRKWFELKFRGYYSREDQLLL